MYHRPSISKLEGNTSRYTQIILHTRTPRFANRLTLKTRRMQLLAPRLLPIQPQIQGGIQDYKDVLLRLSCNSCSVII